SLLVLFFKKVDKATKKLIIANLVLFVITLFVMSPGSKILWAHISILRQFQMPWRFLAIISFVTSMLSISFFYFDFFKKKWVYALLIILVVGSTAFYWKPLLGYEKINEKYYWNFPLTTTYW